MKKANMILSALRSDISRLCITSGFYLSIVLITGINLLNLLDEVKLNLYGRETSSVYYFFVNRSGLGAFNILLLILCALPFATCFISDIRNDYLRYAVIRVGRKTYCASKVIVTATSAFLSCIIGYLLLVAILSCIFPLFPRDTLSGTQTIFAQLLHSRFPFLFYIVSIIPEALTYSSLAVFALYISTKIPNFFVVLSSPIIFYYIWTYIGGAIGVPNTLVLHVISAWGILPNESITLNIAATFGFHIAIICLLGWLFSVGVRKRCQGE